MGQKEDRKYQNQEMSTFLFALDYVLESLQRSRLYVNNKKIIKEAKEEKGELEISLGGEGGGGGGERGGGGRDSGGDGAGGGGGRGGGGERGGGRGGEGRFLPIPALRLSVVGRSRSTPFDFQSQSEANQELRRLRPSWVCRRRYKLPVAATLTLKIETDMSMFDKTINGRKLVAEQ